MNTPAIPEGNWSWRAPENCWTPDLAAKLAALIEATDRDNDPLGAPLSPNGETAAPATD
jgi:4-alpha-glucanotransferase